MIKKMLGRLRRWLILKLGGYTEQKIITSRNINVNANVRYKVIRASYTMKREQFEREGERAFAAYGKLQLIQIMAQELIESDAVILEREDDLYKGVVELRAKLYVLDSDYAKMFLDRPWEIKG